MSRLGLAVHHDYPQEGAILCQSHQETATDEKIAIMFDRLIHQ